MSLRSRTRRPAPSLITCALVAALAGGTLAATSAAASPTPPGPLNPSTTTATTPKVSFAHRTAAPSVQAAGTGVQEYVVTYRDEVAASSASEAEAQRAVSAMGIRTQRRFDRAVNGFAATLDPTQYDTLRRDPRIDKIEPNITIRSTGVQVDPPWGLDRLEQGTGARFDRQFTYFDEAQGASADIYIFDSGLRSDHVEFRNRVAVGGNFIEHEGPESLPNSNTSDCFGHGTHVAGTAAGTYSGVAKKARIVPVRVLNCDGDGDLISVLDGISWTIDRATDPANAGRRAVANLSLGGAYSSILNEAVTAMTDANIAVSVAAGNDGMDVSNISPASEPTSVTVGAVNPQDAAQSFSNYGEGLDVWAPGVDIASAWNDGPTEYALADGTSMAAPHVAGVMAVLRAANHGDTAAAVAGKTSVRDRLLSLARAGVQRTSRDSTSSTLLVQSPTGAPPVCTVAEGFLADSAGRLRPVVDESVLTGTKTMRPLTQLATGWTPKYYSWMGQSSDGVVYLISRTGDVRWYRFVNGRWQPGSSAVVSRGWRLGDNVTSIEVTKGGDFYVVSKWGELKLYRHTGYLTGASTWKSWTIGRGWNEPQLLAPNGDGVLYRQRGGVLYWFKHSDPATGLRWERTRVVGKGWWFQDLVPLGGGELYAIDSKGAVRSYRNSGFATGDASWDAIRIKGWLGSRLGFTLDAATCS